MQKIREQINKILACPQCLSDLEPAADRFECRQCARPFLIQNGAVKFVDGAGKDSKDAQFQSEQMFNNTRTARLFNWGRKIISSEYVPHDHLTEFIKQTKENDVVVELGSGNRRLGKHLVNIDLFPFPNVDLVADMAHAPIKTGSVDFVVLDTVLEHVPEPHKVVQELYRILKPGGQAICITPFVFPYHGYPKHYYNFSKDGLEFLFKDFSSCKVEAHMGPTVAMINFFAECFSVALSGKNKFLYTLCKGAALLPIFPLKYLDKLWDPAGGTVRVASLLCTWVEK